jgi:predicted RNase H-like nuclease
VNTHNPPKGSTCIIGFDSAWTDNSKAPGAVCAIVIAGDGGVSFKPPCHVSFDQAFAFIDAERRDTCLVAIGSLLSIPSGGSHR